MLDKQSKMVLDSIIANESQYERYFLQKDKPLDISDDEMERILCGLAAGGLCYPRRDKRLYLWRSSHAEGFLLQRVPAP